MRSDVDDCGRSPGARLGAILSLLVVLAVGPSCSPAEDEAGGEAGEGDGAPVAVETATATMRTHERTIRVRATLAPSRTLRITPEVGGVAEEIYPEKGESVEEGDPLVRVASVSYSLRVDAAKSQKRSARAGLARAEARLKAAEKQYERFERLYEEDVVAKSQFEEVESAYRQAKAAHESARAKTEGAETGIEQARRQVEDTVVRAPFDGHVVRRMLDEGAVVRPMASPVMVLIDDDPIRVEGSVSELHLSEVEEGMPARVRVDTYEDRSFEGTVETINPQVSARTREADVRVELTNENGELSAGMSGSLTLEVGATDRIMIPREAIVEREGRRATVYVVDAGRAQRRELQIEPGFESSLPVLEGLSEDERVVTWGGTRLTDGARVDVRDGSESENDGAESSSDRQGESR